MKKDRWGVIIDELLGYGVLENLDDEGKQIAITEEFTKCMCRAMIRVDKKTAEYPDVTEEYKKKGVEANCMETHIIVALVEFFSTMGKANGEHKGIGHQQLEDYFSVMVNMPQLKRADRIFKELGL